MTLHAIGEFSKITGLTVKALRFYHDKGLLVPTYVDSGSGYRYYESGCVDKARVIVALRGLGFSLEVIADILRNYEDEGDILDYLEQRRRQLDAQIEECATVSHQLQLIIRNEQEARDIMNRSSFSVEEKTVEPVRIASIRMQGRYSDCGKGFGRIGKHFGRFIAGKPLMLHHDTEYREEDADFEVCMPVRKERKVDGITVRELPGGRCVSLLHLGPYEEIGRSYQKLREYVEKRGLKTAMPSREVYLKGPGMLFRGNPKKYLTEIQFLIAED